MTRLSGAYKYKDPLKEGYILSKVSLEDLKLLGFGLSMKRKRYLEYAEVYFHPEKEQFKIFYLARILTIVLSFILLPISLVFFGISNYKEVLEDHKKLLNQKAYGSFSSDTVFSKDKAYQSLKELHDSKSKKRA